MPTPYALHSDEGQLMTAVIDHLLQLSIKHPGYAVAITLMGIWALAEIIATTVVRFRRKKPQ